METAQAVSREAASSAGTRVDAAKPAFCLVGFAILVGAYLLPATGGLSPQAIRTLAVLMTTVLWWVTETFPVPVTALLVPVMVHALGILPLDVALREAFGNSLIPFMVGVLGLAAALTTCGLGRRISNHLLVVVGPNTTVVVGVYLWMSFIVSMFIDDIAVVAMMLPLVLGLLKSVGAKPGESNFGRAMMMAVMFGSLLGGACTPAGISANVVTLAFLAKNANMNVGFLEWTAIATPPFVAMAAVTWWLILRLFPPELKELPLTREALRAELAAMGPLTVQESSTGVVFFAAVMLWLTSDITKLPIAFVSLLILGAISMPRIGVFSKWRDLNRGIEWGAVMLVVGGFIVGIAAARSGLAAWVVHQFLHPMSALPLALQPAALTLLVAIDSLGLSSIGSTASVNVPFVIAYAQQNGLPVQALTMSAAFASSIHFILVTQSPSTVLPFAAGYFSFKDLAKIGILVTLIGAALVSIGMWLAGMPAGISLPAS